MFILLTVLGFVLILLDLIALPGGVFVIVGSGAILYGIFLNYQDNGILPALIHLVVSLGSAPFLIRYALKRVALKEEMHVEDGYVAVDDHRDLVGQTGVARSDLRPSGSVTVTLENRTLHLDCISQGGYIDQGAEVVIVSDNGPSLVVRRAD